MIKASSSGDHLLCFLAGESETWAGMLRLLLVAGTGPTNGGGGPYVLEGRLATVVAAAEGGTEAGREC
jgi:hypothetical protein